MVLRRSLGLEILESRYSTVFLRIIAVFGLCFFWFGFAFSFVGGNVFGGSRNRFEGLSVGFFVSRLGFSFFI